MIYVFKKGYGLRHEKVIEMVMNGQRSQNVFIYYNTPQVKIPIIKMYKSLYYKTII